MKKKHILVTLTVLMLFLTSGIFAFENKHKIELFVGDKNITVDGKATTTENEPIEKDGKIYVEISTLKHLRGLRLLMTQSQRK